MSNIKYQISNIKYLYLVGILLHQLSLAATATTAPLAGGTSSISRRKVGEVGEVGGKHLMNTPCLLHIRIDLSTILNYMGLLKSKPNISRVLFPVNFYQTVSRKYLNRIIFYTGQFNTYIDGGKQHLFV